jgi:molybdopterin-guanine dinucleotide biosynthesis protein A
VPRPWSSELAAALRRDREELLVLFVAYRAQLRTAEAKEFEGGEEEHSRLVQETEHDYVALASAGAEAARLETTLERADREATEREVDLEAILVRQLRELVAAVAARLPAP